MALIDWKGSKSKSKCCYCGKPVPNWARYYPNLRHLVVKLAKGKVAHSYCHQYAQRTEFMKKTMGVDTGWQPGREDKR